MTPVEIALVKESFAHVLPIADTAAGLFYARLFDIDTTTRGLFARSDMKRQGAKLMAALQMVVEGLEQPETILPAARELSHRHRTYGVTEPQYDSVGEALLWTLQQGLGPRFTPDVSRAWAAAYSLLSRAMLAAGPPAEAPSKLDTRVLPAADQGA